MSNVGYDLDTSGGLMPLIRALIKPPDEDLNVPKPKKPQHPYYKRPGKGHNHDSCDACGEGGDLICCDRCPASFHLGCYLKVHDVPTSDHLLSDPPLEENDIPAGLWLCRECRASDDKPPSTRSSRAQSPSDSKSDTDRKSRSLRNSRANSLNKKKCKEDSKEKEVEESKDKEMESEKDLSPMEILVKAAKIMNPKQFELPREMRIPCNFPGTEKDSRTGSGVVTVDAWGCVPLPARSCFVCRATCKMAPLLQCDYCPLLFHQDCLDPPLTALPTGRWMCPNHVEQYIDWKLVHSISATERVSLWERFSEPVDQQALKCAFIRRARTNRPAFRVKVPQCARGRVLVPRMVRAHYRCPPPLLPSRRDHVRCRTVMDNLKANGDDSDSDDGEIHKICMNLSCPQYTGGQCPMDSPKLRGVSHEDADDDLKAIADNEPKTEKATDSDSSDFDSDLEHVTVKKRKVFTDTNANKKVKVEKLQLREEEGVQELLDTVEEQLRKLDERLVKLLAWQRLQQIAAGEAVCGRWRRGGGGSWGARAAAALGAASRASLARLGVRTLPLPSEILPREDRERIARLVWGAAPRHEPPPPREELEVALVRAVLCEVKQPADGGAARLGASLGVRRAALLAGAGAACDLRLDPACRRVSDTHARIFCDEVTGHFELINYSEWGTRVNGVLYAADVSHSGAAAAAEDTRAEALRDTVRARRTRLPRIEGSLTVSSEREACSCPGGEGATPGADGAWEGSALLPHGALLQFGCRLYVFSIADHDSEQ